MAALTCHPFCFVEALDSFVDRNAEEIASADPVDSELAYALVAFVWG